MWKLIFALLAIIGIAEVGRWLWLWLLKSKKKGKIYFVFSFHGHEALFTGFACMGGQKRKRCFAWTAAWMRKQSGFAS